MDRDKYIGFTLILFLIIIYYGFFLPSQPVNEKIVSEEDEIKIIEENTPEVKSPDKEFLSDEKGEIINLENDNLIVDFNSKGGIIENVYLKNYVNNKSEIVHLYDGSESNINYYYPDENINFDNIIFEYDITKNSDYQKLRFTSISNNGNKISITYDINKDSYLINNSVILNEGFSKSEFLNITWNNKPLHHELNTYNEKNQSTINYLDDKENFDYLDYPSTNNESIELDDPLKWISIKQQYFNSSLISNDLFYDTKLKSNHIENDDFVKNFIIESKILLNNNSFSVDYYFGPNDYKILDNISTDFDKNIYLGFETIGVRAFNKYFLIPIFNFLKNFTSNYGLIILLMVIVIRLIITPLTYKSHISMAKMKVLNPEIQSIREKHDGDMQKSQAETMELYQKTGVSPLGGCLPIVLQMPILISVFYFIPNMIEFRGKSFLWASDLSTYDSIIDLPFSIPFYGSHISLFTLLMAFSIMLMNKTNMQMQANMDGPMKYFQYFIPVMMLFFFNSFASGLTYYYFLTNIATYGQMNIFKRFVDESKIKEEIEFNRKKNINSKKSSFQIRLDEAMKARQNKNKK